MALSDKEILAMYRQLDEVGKRIVEKTMDELLRKQEKEEQQLDDDVPEPRIYVIDLTEGEVISIARAAGSYNQSVSEYLQWFIGDSPYKCSDLPVKNRSMVSYWNSDETDFEFEELEKVLSEINSMKTAILEIEEELESPEKCDWEKHTTWDAFGNVIPAYKNLQEYLEKEKQVLHDDQRDLRYAEKSLSEIQEDFKHYMQDKEYSWEEELENYKKWYKENVADRL